MEPLDALARAVTLGLGGLTQLSYQLFDALGVDMTSVDQALAGWTDYANQLEAQNAELKQQNTDVTSQLETANQTIQQLKDTDAAEDAAQAQALTDQIAQQIQDALDAAKAEPTTPDPTPPEGGGGETPTEPPTPVDPEAPPTPAGELPPDTPVVEVPPDSEPPHDIPPDAPVTPAGELPPETPVVPVEPPAEGSPEDPQVNPLREKRRR